MDSEQWRQTYWRAVGALAGLALGDALGMPTQSMSVHDIVEEYGGPVDGLLDATETQPIAPNMPAGSVTDDTEQAFLLAQRLIEDNPIAPETCGEIEDFGTFPPAPESVGADGTLLLVHPPAGPVTAHRSDARCTHDRINWEDFEPVCPAPEPVLRRVPIPPASGEASLDSDQYAADLLKWESKIRARGSLDLLGPSTRRALHALEAGASIHETGREGTTNGGAMRAAPIGIAFSPEAPDDLLGRMARESCLVTHNTTNGIEATTLIAAAVSYGIAGYPSPLQSAVAYVIDQPAHGHWTPKASVLARTQQALAWAKDGDGAALDDESFAIHLRREFGTSVEANESVPAAFAIAQRFWNDPTKALCFAASIGGDTDTIAAMAGAMLGAAHGPFAFDGPMREQVLATLRDVNHLEIPGTARRLCMLRFATL